MLRNTSRKSSFNLCIYEESNILNPEIKITAIFSKEFLENILCNKQLLNQLIETNIFKALINQLTNPILFHPLKNENFVKSTAIG